MTTFGNCSKHPNFAKMDCPLCEADKKIELIEEKIEAGKYIISASRKKIVNLNKHKAALRVVIMKAR